MSDVTAKEMVTILNRAIELAPRYVPVLDRQPTLGGGPVLITATGLLVALRALVEAIVEEGEKKKP